MFTTLDGSHFFGPFKNWNINGVRTKCWIHANVLDIEFGLYS